MITTGDIKKGMTLNIDGELVKVIDFQHVKQGRGTAFMRLVLKNLRTGSNTTRTFMAGEKFEQARLERQVAQYLYRDGDYFHFMNTQTFDQLTLNEEVLGSAINYTKENDVIDILYYGDTPIDVELPTAVNLEVVETEPGFKGDTATGGNKPARVETGLLVNVPLFVSTGDVIKVDTRTGEYLERVS